MRLFKAAAIPAMTILIAFGAVAADIAADIKKLQGKTSDLSARDRKGEPADVILEKTVTGEKPRMIQTPAMPAAVADAAKTPQTKSRLDIWKERRRQQQDKEQQNKQ